jgi:signal transduction histidine kinase
MALQVDKVSMYDLAKLAVSEVAAKAEKEEVKIIVEDSALNIESNRRAHVPDVVADKDKIDEVIINLVGNAVKFTPAHGSITISFRYDTEFVYVSVTDTGIGIEEKMLDKLFVKFGLIDNSYRGNKETVQGTGLGLYLSKKLVELHGGTVTVSSAGVDQGSTFTFSLPVYSAQTKEEIQRKQKGRPLLGSLKRV